jgi:tRNA-splicing ligase RtcB
MPAAHELVAFGPVEEDARKQLDRCLDAGGDEARGVLCADHHKGYSMPIGGVLASQSVVMPAGVGYDIACGNCAVRTDLTASDLDVKNVMDAIWTTISFGVGRKNDEPIRDAPVFDAIAHSPVPQQPRLLDLARAQLGTVGSGNHYVDLLEDRADGRLWVGVHFGSRGFGHKTASGFLALADGRKWAIASTNSMDAPPSTIQLERRWRMIILAAMNIAGEYAYAGRDWARESRAAASRCTRRTARPQSSQLRLVGRTRRPEVARRPARGPHRRFPASSGSWADRWATMR